MSVSLIDMHDGGKNVLCCFTDETGSHWCLKAITNINPKRFSRVFVCCGQQCNFKLFYASQTDFCVSGVHRCVFDHEREYKKRVRNQLAMNIIRENVILRPRDVIEMVKRKIDLTEREKKSLHQFISRHISVNCSSCPQSIQDFVVPDKLKVVIDTYGDIGDDNFLVHDSKTNEPDSERILIFASYSMRQRAAIAKELYADGTYRTVSNVFATLYTIHTTIDGVSYPVFFILMPNEQTPTFKRAFAVIRPYMRSFTPGCIVHVDCQLAAINAFTDTFACNVRICLFHQNQAVWRAVSRFGLAGAYNSITQPKLHIWIRRLLSLPFLSADDITREFKRLFEHEALQGTFCVEDPFKEPFRQLVEYYDHFWMTRVPVESWCQHESETRTNNVCEGFHNGLRQVVGVVHPNPNITIQLLRRVDKEATNKFCCYLKGNAVRRIRKRAVELQEKIRLVVERYRAHKGVIRPNQFLDQISSAYLEFYHNEKLARRNISLNVVSLSKQHLDAVANVLDEQDRYDPLEDSENVCDYVERDARTEILFDTMLETTELLDGEVRMDVEEADGCSERGNGDACPSQVPERVGDGKRRGSKRASVTKPRRERRKPPCGSDRRWSARARAKKAP